MNHSATEHHADRTAGKLIGVFGRSGRRANQLVPVFVAVACIAIGSTMLVYWMGLRVTSANLAVVQSVEIIVGLEDLLSTLKDVETGQRGFLLTGDEKYLEPYDDAVQHVGVRLEHLARWARTGDVQRDWATAAARLTGEKLDELKQTIAARRQEGVEAAKAIVQSGAGKRIMDDLRSQIKRLTDHEQAELLASQKQRDAAIRMRTLVTAGASLVTLAFLIWAFGRIRQGIASVEAQKQLLAVTLGSIGDAVIVTDLQGRVTFLNAEGERLTGWTLAEAQGQPLSAVFKIVNQMTRQAVESPVDRVMRLGMVVGLANHTILIARDGRETPIDDSGAPVRSADGRMHGVVLVFRDIAQRYAAEAKLRESQKENEFLAGLIRASSQPVGIGYPDGRLGLVNLAFEELTGYTGDELRSIDWAAVLTPPEWREMERDKLAELHRMGRPVRYEKEYIRKDGTRVPIELLVHLVSDAEGKPQYYYSFLTDITERKRVDEAMRESEERFRTAFEDAAIATTLTALDGKLLRMNGAFCQMLGYTQEELAGRDFADFTHPEDIGANLVGRQRLLTGEISSFRMEKRYLRKDGSIMWGDMSTASVRDARGQPLYCVTHVQDITDRKNREEELRQLNRTLRAMSNSDQVMMRATDELQYVKDVCAIVVKDCGHAMAWVGYALQDEGQTVEVIAHAGAEQGYLRMAQITWADTERGRGPTGTAIREGQVSICNNMLTDPRFGPWRQEAAMRGYASSIALPLSAQGKTLGALTIYSSEPAPFSEEEVALLRELAGDLAHGIISIRLRQAHAQAEDALRRSEERYRSLFSTMIEGFCIIEVLFDADHRPIDYRFLEINPAFEAQTGLRNVQGRTIREIAPENEAHWFEIYGRVALTGEPARFVNEAKALGRWFDVSAYRIGGNGSRKVAILFNDITERRQAAEAMAKARNTLQATLDSMTDGYYALDGEWRFVAANRLTEEHFGRPMEELRGQNIWQLTGTPQDSPISRRFQEAKASGRPVHFEAPSQLRPGFWAHMHVYPRDGGLEVYYSDISERKRAEEELRAAKISAEQAKAGAEMASKAKDHFLAVLSHELRTPLAPVVATLAMLQEDPRFDADTRENLEMIRRNVELEARLIDDLLDVTRIERGKVELDKQPVDLGTIIRRAAEVCMPDIEARKLEFRIDIPDGPYLVDADVARLQQVIWNLLKNAVKFTPKGGCVGIRVRREGLEVRDEPREKTADAPPPPLTPHPYPLTPSFVIVQVNDSGEGIDPQVLPRLFNAFEQGDRRVTRQFGGLGLGLAISKAITEMHGGTLSAYSEGKGKGATFAVRLPLVTGHSSSVTGQWSGRPGMVTKDQGLMTNDKGPMTPLRILLVEDHGDTARIMRRLLSANGACGSSRRGCGDGTEIGRGTALRSDAQRSGPARWERAGPDARHTRQWLESAGHRPERLRPGAGPATEPRGRLRGASGQTSEPAKTGGGHRQACR